MLDVLSYPVSWILRLWHDATVMLVGTPGAGWVVAVALLVVSLRLLLLRPALAQARGAAQLRELQPRVAALRKRHRHDRARLTAEIHKLHVEHGVSPAAGRVSMLLQLPVLIGLSHLVYALGRTPSGEGRFVFGASDVRSFETARLAGGRIISGLLELGGHLPHLAAHVTAVSAAVSVLLIVVVSIGAHVNARLAMRSTVAAPARWIRWLTLWGTPAGALLAGPFLATAILVYWATNTLCTLAQTTLIAHRLAPART